MEELDRKKECHISEAGEELDDRCDLDPNKICDNCCKCLEVDEDYRVVTTDFLFNDAEMVEELPLCELSEGEECEDLTLQIDPALMAEWEAKLAAFEDTREEEFPMLSFATKNMHGARRRTEKGKE